MFNRFINTFEKGTLPLSANKYHLLISGIVTDKNGTVIIPRKNSLGDLVVQIDWINGYTDYSVALLLAHTFKPLRLSFKWWNKISVLYADGDRSNIHPSNLVWKFPVALGTDVYSGFAFIPMHSRYMINKDGAVYDNCTRRILNKHFNKGYYSYSLMPDIGPRVTLKRHRALCLAFTDYPANVDLLDVNHKNGIPGSDELDNLEWVTSSENRIHAIVNGLTLINKPVIARNLINGEQEEYFSLDAICKKLKLNEKKVSVALGQVNGVFLYGNYELRYKKPEHAFLGNCNKCPILVRDLRTGVVTEYESIVSCAEKTGLTKHSVSGRIEYPTTNLYPDYLQIKRKSDSSPWYVPEDYEQELLQTSWAKKILVKYVSRNIVAEFNTQREAAKDIGISESTIVKWLSFTNQPVFRHQVNGEYIQIKRKSDQSSWREVKNPEEEHLLSLCTKPVLVKNVNTNQVTEFPSATECANEFGILVTTLNWRLKSQGQKTYYPGFQFKYKSESLPFKMDNEKK